jgi:glycerol-3-phosphate dehydrogenase (NAD(P)+)
MKLAVLGGGSWGTALSIVLAPRFERIGLWAFEADLAERMARSRENDVFLPGFKLPENIYPTAILGEALEDAQIVLGVVPSHHLRAVFTQALPFLTGEMIFVSAAKGIETHSLLRMSQVLEGVVPGRIAVLSGPTFAREIAKGEPAAVVISSKERDLAERIQGAFSGPAFRLYTNTDPVGVEIGASLKNVIAIGAGICQGLGLGSNAVAALITRGLAEITRLATAMGGQPATLAGLAGLGDLVLTCTGDLSRNRRLGVELARGRKLEEILASTRMVAEGVQTTYAAAELYGKHNVEMPITEQMYQVLRMGKDPRDALRELMERALKRE